MLKRFFLFFKYQKILRDVYDHTDFIKALSLSFKSEFRRDRINRLYTVVNPYIHNMGVTGNNIIYGDDGVAIVDKWVMDNFIVIDSVLKNHDLFDIITYEITRLDDDLNFAVVLSNALLKDFLKVTKIIVASLLSIILLIIILAIFL